MPLDRNSITALHVDFVVDSQECLTGSLDITIMNFILETCYIDRCCRKKAFIYGMAMHPESTLIGKHDHLLICINCKFFLFYAVINWI